MKNLITTSLLVLITIPSFGFITQKSINTAVQKARVKNVTQVSTGSQPGSSSACADLSGTWEGQCKKMDGSLVKTKLKITQSQCVGLKMITIDPFPEDSFTLSVDMTGVGISSIANSSVFASFNASYAGRWNTDNTVASIAISGIVNSVFLGNAQAVKGTMQFLRKEDKLLQFSKYEGFNAEDGDESCEFSKVN